MAAPAPESRSGIEVLDSEDERACRRRQRRSHGQGRLHERSRRSLAHHRYLPSRQAARARHGGCKQCSRQLRSHGAAIGPQGRRAFRLHAATVRALVTLLQTDCERGNHHRHQENGHRRALKKGPQHGLSLTRQPAFSVIPVTSSGRHFLKFSRSPASLTTHLASTSDSGNVERCGIRT